MNNIQIIIWTFPILFIFHDFEEIIFIRGWLRKNRLYIKKRFPNISKKLLPHFENVTTESFAFGVAEEFIIISLVTIIAYAKDWYYLWIGLFIAFTLHLLIHCLQALIIRKYIPAIFTSVICLPICIYIIKQLIHEYMLKDIIIYSILAFVLMILNLVLIHRSMKMLNKWLVTRL